MRTAINNKLLWDVPPDRVGKLGDRLFPFWTPEQFGQLIERSSQQVRYFIRELGAPVHGTTHKGRSNMRLGESALDWFKDYYLPHSERRGRHFHFRHYIGELSDEVECHYLDEKQAWARLYGEPIPYDKYLEDNPDEKRKWKKFVEVKVDAKQLAKWNQEFRSSAELFTKVMKGGRNVET